MCNIYEDLLVEKESDIDNIILKKETPYKRELMERVNEIAGEYVTELLGIFRELGIDFRTTFTVFAGGGSILLSEFIREAWKRYQGKYVIILQHISEFTDTYI